MSNPADYLIEILPWPAGQNPGDKQPVDITDDVTLDDFGSINRAVERDFLSFRTGDVTLGLINEDGKFDDLFALFGATDRWQLRIARRGRTIFLGIVLGQGSVTFSRLDRMVEITAYGATKVLDETSAETVKRAIADMTVTTATSGASTMTLNTTAGLLTGDTLHVTDHVNKEDVTVKQVTSATVVALEGNLANTYASGSPVVLSTPFYRYKTPDFLVRELFKAAAVPVAELKISGSLFRRLAPTPANLTGLDLTKAAYSNPCEKDGAAFVTLIDPTTTNTGPGTYSQASPDADWIKEGTDLHPWVDWSRYYLQDEAGPAVVIRNPQNVKAGATQFGNDPHHSGFDYRPATKIAYYIWATLTSPDVLAKRTTTDGTTWTARATVSNLGGEADDIQLDQGYGVEFDPQRNFVFCWWRRSDNAFRFRYWDVVGAAWVDCLQADDAGKGYFGAVYVPELDAVLALRSSTWNGPAFEIAAFRGATRLWVRPFPNCLIKNEQPGQAEGANYPTNHLRYVSGSLYCLAISDGALQIIRSDDEFRSYVMRKIVENTSNTYYFGGRVEGQYVIAGYQGATPRAYLVAAPFYAGVVSYADFGGKSCAEALQELALLVKATFWVDDDFQGHFVARDQVPAGDIPDLTERDLLLEQSEVQVWEESRQHVKVSGGGFEATAGDPNFSADSLSISSTLMPNAAYAQSLADDSLAFVGPRRAVLPARVFDEEDLQLHPMRRVFVDGRRFYVHESDHSPGDDEWSVKLLEDLENQAAA